jgi:hypothetical protein
VFRAEFHPSPAARIGAQLAALRHPHGADRASLIAKNVLDVAVYGVGQSLQVVTHGQNPRS